MILIFIALVGLIIGSFLAAFTYRYSRGISSVKGRSFCDNCGKKLAWFDNIPVVSFLLLRGLSRCCGKKISPRYPLIELLTSSVFFISYLRAINCIPLNYVCDLSSVSLSFIFLIDLIFFAMLIAVLIIDFENYIIPDELTFLLILLSFTSILLNPLEINIYNNFFSGFFVSVILLFLHFITKKKGMGLGDVKLALPIGIILGIPLSIVWLLTSFVIGAIIGVILMLFGKKGLKSKVPFGPFLVIAFFIVFFFGDIMRQLIIPF